MITIIAVTANVRMTRLSSPNIASRKDSSHRGSHLLKDHVVDHDLQPAMVAAGLRR